MNVIMISGVNSTDKVVNKNNNISFSATRTTKGASKNVPGLDVTPLIESVRNVCGAQKAGIIRDQSPNVVLRNIAYYFGGTVRDTQVTGKEVAAAIRRELGKKKFRY